MRKYVLKKILFAIPILIGITIIDYLFMSYAGNPLQMIHGPKVSQAAVHAKEIEYGLNKPFYIQYLVWLNQILHGNFGYSYKSFQPVSDLIASHVGPTLLLMGSALFISIALSIPVAIYSATHQYSKGDYTIVTASFVGTSIPSFFSALVVIYLFTVKLGWLPSSGMSTLGENTQFGDVFRHLLLPVIVLVAATMGSNVRYIRSAMLEILQKDYLLNARAKGIGRFLVINKHALKNALIPIITVIGMQIPLLFGGTVIIEQIFSWPGLGLLTMTAVLNNDYPVIMGVCLLTAVVVLITNLLTDILYAAVDPTITFK
ncbi:ABC transporter permease [Sporolactobacillus laevolacticus]|uniref:Peptide ABC transporter permease n=1 Tax=Sporolactobacillus laevolacticus DSM 442 TaxID=1395513 RepID=V6IUQ0_9BACL|nr:ABC transporter permease [Sporolactobacillus laevolacticus]EST10878.1 peptide ABC transporter permease [Sporolactobacillus laevolacticus DSM 442]